MSYMIGWPGRGYNQESTSLGNVDYGCVGAFTGAVALREVIFEDGIPTVPDYALYDAEQ